MQIGELAERTGLSLHTIRHYDEVGLVEPSSRSEGGFRLYSEADLQRLLLIRRMKPLGFTLEEMRSLLETVDALPASGGAERERLVQALQGFIASAQQRRAKLATQLAMADEFIGLLQEQGAP
jgi:MerR family transcriptional regulator, copper efflux regulator